MKKKPQRELTSSLPGHKAATPEKPLSQISDEEAIEEIKKVLERYSEDEKPISALLKTSSIINKQANKRI